MQVDQGEYAAELRAARVAVLLTRVADGVKDVQAWLADLSAVLSECPTDERRELASELLVGVFIKAQPASGFALTAPLAEQVAPRSLVSSKERLNAALDQVARLLAAP